MVTRGAPTSELWVRFLSLLRFCKLIGETTRLRTEHYEFESLQKHNQ